MLEIILLIFMCRNIGEIALKKGRKPIGYQLMVVGLWFGGEIIFGIVAAVLMAGSSNGTLVVYLAALTGAAIGAVIAFQIARSATPSATAVGPGMGSAFPVIMPGPTPPSPFDEHRGQPL